MLFLFSCFFNHLLPFTLSFLPHPTTIRRLLPSFTRSLSKMSAPAETQNLVFILDDDITAEEKAHVKQSITNKGGKITSEPEIINALFVTMPKQQNGFASLETLHEKISGIEVDGSVSTQK